MAGAKMKLLYYAYRYLTHPKAWKELNLADLMITYCRTLNKRVSIPEFVSILTSTDPRAVDISANLDLSNRMREKPILFALVRALKPSVVVETGVGGGYSSAFILAGLQRNSSGALYSIDKREVYSAKYYGCPKNLPLGGIIPAHLKQNWTLLDCGSENDLLPLLERLGQIDIFIHDSLHTKEMATFEYRAAWKHLRIGGLLISHDVWRPWFNFCKEVNRVPAIHDVYGGIKK